MSRFALLRTARVTRTQKVATVVLAAAGATTALAVTASPSQAAPVTAAHAPAAVKPVSANGLPKTGADKSAEATSGTVSAAGHLKVTAVDKQGHAAKQAASRSAERQAPKSYANNLDGWIHQSLDIMKNKGIPGSYEGLHRNIMRESSGNPNAVNGWDINAVNGIPSKGLLQVIQPTFDTYHVKGTAHKLTDPVANITAAANYAAHRYGSIDNVNSAY
ncbi:transglycosylase SLT domain-containing protein [Streptomyces benahoarensis]|uniref:Lytic transglycosylase n=1 Tax=Streptomyces benahoarensis TaxID=2595054 RepID=A0A553ZDL7_9ACTN|nr:transglycosylase SLT domain-containing protein [Streptomyces benahoarensis]TSB21137.1 lytic transglycosylase [Streptomyces benahoarensis]TSB39533.1 lytic transglycosylase [Streptomyces benahoarensis]